MPVFASPIQRKQQRTQESATTPKQSGRAAQLQRRTAGMSYADGQAAVSPEPTAKVDGPIGRVFNRILGKSDSADGTATMTFDKKQLRNYLDKTINFADDEWFRGTKLDGVTDKLMETLDKDGDGRVTWGEFQAFKTQVLSQLAPGVDKNSTPEQVAASSNKRFDQFDTNRKDGSLNFEELQAGSKAELPKETEHADLIAQLGARIALDAVDTDQRDKAVKDRTLSRAEWTNAASQLAR